VLYSKLTFLLIYILLLERIKLAENTDLGNGNRNGIDKEKFKAALDAAIGIVKSGPKADQYWELGKKVSDAVAETNLTKTIMREISDQSGLGFDTIRKCKKFNGDYGADELKKIMEAYSSSIIQIHHPTAK
jgi:hypothetical protein